MSALQPIHKRNAILVVSVKAPNSPGCKSCAHRNVQKFEACAQSFQIYKPDELVLLLLRPPYYEE